MINKILLSILVRKIRDDELKLEDVKSEEYKIEAKKILEQL
jgi:hypothetical protein